MMNKKTHEKRKAVLPLSSRFLGLAALMLATTLVLSNCQGANDPKKHTETEGKIPSVNNANSRDNPSGGNTGSGEGSGSGSGGGSGNGGNSSGGGLPIPAIDPDEQWVKDAISKAAVSPTVIVGTGKKITLSGDNIKWTSDKLGIINVTEEASGEYRVTSPEEKDKVTLTAKAVKGTFTKERTFTVIVHKEESTLTAEELIKSINLPTETEVDISLPVEIDGVSGTGITWTSGSEQTIHIEKSLHKAVITRELGDVPVKLTAKLTYKSTMVEKEFTVTVKRITKITATKSDTGKDGMPHTIHTAYTFTDTTITYENDDKNDTTDFIRKSGSHYTFSDLNLSAHTFTAQRTHTRNGDGRWFEIGSAEHRHYYMSSIEVFKHIAQLAKKDVISLQDLRVAFSADGGTLPNDDKELFKIIQYRMDLVTGEYEDFIKLLPEAQTAMIKKQIDSLRKEYANSYDLAETATWDELLPVLKRDTEKEFEKRYVAKAKTPFKYTYKLQRDPGTDKYGFKEASVLYDNTKTWFNQRGDYRASNNIWISTNNDEVIVYDGKVYSIKLNAEGTQLTGKERFAPTGKKKTITATIADNRNGTVSITVKGNTHELSFEGDNLW